MEREKGREEDRETDCKETNEKEKSKKGRRWRKWGRGYNRKVKSDEEAGRKRDR